MKRFFTNSIFLAFVALIISSCGGKKASNPEINGMDTYKDAVTGLEVKYPKGWEKGNAPGESFVAYSSPEAKTEFLNLGKSSEDVPGARIYVKTLKIEEGKTIDETVDATREFEKPTYAAPTEVTIDGLKAFKQTYTFPLNTTQFNGEIYYVTKDSQMVNIITFDVIGDQYETLKPKFQSILASMKLGVLPQRNSPKTRTDTVEQPGPSDKFVASIGQGFSIQMPDNFSVTNPSVKGTEKSFFYSGDRRGDSYVQIGILDAKGNKLDKILEDNAKNFGPASKTNVGGVAAGVFNYKAKADLDSKIYFVVQGGKLYRIFVNYYKPDAKLYKPAFDKMMKKH